MRNYSFLNTILLVSAPPIVPVPVQITGFWEGDDVIEAGRNVDGMTHVIGAGGEMSASQSADLSGKIGLKLSALSASNQLLLRILRAQETGGLFAPSLVSFADILRQDGFVGYGCYIQKLPDIKRGGKVVAQDWMFMCEKFIPEFGNPAFAGFALNG